MPNPNRAPAQWAIDAVASLPPFHPARLIGSGLTPPEAFRAASLGWAARHTGWLSDEPETVYRVYEALCSFLSAALPRGHRWGMAILNAFEEAPDLEIYTALDEAFASFAADALEPPIMPLASPRQWGLILAHLEPSRRVEFLGRVEELFADLERV